ncbi:PaaX family transcriptional regulator C-terminal domain-containing protein [Ruegeria sp.]|uniref:PaaX family transcriptional regulator C-terminal domain-containing protein n=1 Tax=Ruegeria sp. TaxID=1879320 RepID=UPI0023235D07|nr:PaaX family transcriptional regulator C-terminal domain-containing protein [Ruegeria sp.]MDA7966273.1 PaaX family transcriptional regulator [Ruegeria sp.]
MTSKDTWFDTAVAALADPQDQRVWSIIVSLFGDLAQAPGAQISGSALTRVIEPIGIKPEAIRVALHRLRKDGWIESDRIGRVSMHFLSDYGRTQSAAVTPRIYARTSATDRKWHLLIAEDGAGMQVLDELMLSHDCTPITRTVALGPGPVPVQTEGVLSFEVSPHTVPQWVQDRLCPDDLRQACRSLLEDVQQATRTRPAGWSATPIQAATLRTLLVHRWRRVVLRQPDVPAEFFPPDWTGPACRDAVLNLLDTLPRPAPDILNATT